MKPPQHLIDRMLADGETGIISSVICLGAALAARRGSDADLLSVQTPEGEPMPQGLEARLKAGHRRAVEEMNGDSPEELDHAIALYSEHLRQAGYMWTAGKGN